MELDVETMKGMLEGMLKPWHQAVENPAPAQRAALSRLLAGYAQTTYGREHGAPDVETMVDYRRAFPVSTYEDYQPLLKRVMAGEIDLLLNEEAVGWAITRGTTGEQKFIPMTPTDLMMRASAARAMMTYVAGSGRYDLFEGVNLNLNFPSEVGTVCMGDREVSYGYSSGIYVKLPLGGWGELDYEACRDENVTLVGGVAPTAIRFARYLHREHGVYPKDLWQTQIVTLGSVPGINTRYRPALRALYGPVVIREIYGTTEGMFGQQRDDRRAWVPNYDLFLFEVEVGLPSEVRDTFGGPARIKMLHEMEPGETGSLVVSTPVLPRYKIGDLVVALRPPYFRCIGRDRWWTPLVYGWHELATLNMGRL